MTTTTDTPRLMATEVHKGQTLFNTVTGEPNFVTKTRKLKDGVRVYLEHRPDFDILEHGTLRYTRVLTADLAATWAATLREREQFVAKRQAQEDAKRAAIAKHRDLYNAPMVYGPTTHHEDSHGLGSVQLRMGGTYYCPNHNTGEPDEHTRELSVLVHKSGDMTWGEDGKTQWAETFQVNWSALGSTDTATARRYAQMILEACEQADSRNARGK